MLPVPEAIPSWLVLTSQKGHQPLLISMLGLQHQCELEKMAELPSAQEVLWRPFAVFLCTLFLVSCCVEEFSVVSLLFCRL